MLWQHASGADDQQRPHPRQTHPRGLQQEQAEGEARRASGLLHLGGPSRRPQVLQHQAGPDDPREAGTHRLLHRFRFR